MKNWFGSAVIAGAFVLAGAVGVAANAQTPPATDTTGTTGTSGTSSALASPCPSPSASNSMVQSTLANANCTTPKPGATPITTPVSSSKPGPVASPMTGTGDTNGSSGGAMTTPHP